MWGKNSAWRVFGALLVALAAVVAIPATADAADTDVVLSEVMYHAADGSTDDDDDYDFIEVTNRGEVAVDITGWELADAVDFVFPVYAATALGRRSVVDADGAVVPGLYAVGAVAAHLPMNGAEYASGLSLGPGSFFGRRAGRHAAGAGAGRGAT